MRKSSIYASKRASVLDLVFLPGVIFSIALIVICAVIAYKNINDGLLADSDIASDPAVVARLQSENIVFPAWADFVVVSFFIGCWIYMLVSAWYRHNHPAFFWVGAVFFVLAFILSRFFGFGWEDLSADSEIASYFVNIPMTLFIMNNLGKMIIGTAITVLIALFAKNNSS